MKTLFAPFLMILTILISSCSNQRQVTAETDDIYFSAKDRAQQQTTNVTVVKPAIAPEFQEDASSDDGYFVKGSAKSQDDGSDESYYSEEEAAQVTTTTSADGTTINNFYGTTNYYEDDYDASYASRIRRFNSTNVVVGYSYYDPYFIDPYWNYGWSYWDPYYYSGWNVGWNSYAGWGVGYGWNSWNPRYGYYGNSYYYSRWRYRDYYAAWGYPSPYCYGYGNNGYWNGYNNGYANGWNDGAYGGNGYNRRATLTGRRGTANETGFVSNTGRSSSPNRDIQDKVSGRPLGIVDREGQSPSPSRKDGMIASADRLNGSSSIYKIDADRLNNASKTRNPSDAVLTGGSTIGKDNQPMAKKSPVAQPVSSRVKYEASQLARTPKVEQRYGASVKRNDPNISRAPQQSDKRGSVNRNREVVPISSGRNPSSSGTTQQPGRDGAVPSRTLPSNKQKPNYYRSPERQSTVQDNSRSRTRYEQPQQPNERPRYDRYQQKPSTSPTVRDRNYSPSRQKQERSVNPSRSVSPSKGTYNAPTRSTTPNRSFDRPSSTPSRGSMSVPSRSSSPGGSMSSPSRSSSPNGSGSRRR
ncbi:MAG: hypothetical protein RLP15_10210 [Cryomorphaceae bacterium]